MSRARALKGAQPHHVTLTTIHTTRHATTRAQSDWLSAWTRKRVPNRWYNADCRLKADSWQLLPRHAR